MGTTRLEDQGHARWRRYRDALRGESLPVALVDVDALDANIARLIAPARAGKKTLRLATKSIRCPSLIRRIVERGEGVVRGLMTYTADETAFLYGEGHRDLLLAYPTVQPRDLAVMAELNRDATASIVIDSDEQLPPLARAASAAGTTIPVILDVDVAFRPFGFGHIGVRRSPLRRVEEIVSLAARVAETPGLRFFGVMAYEAQIAGLTDAGPFDAWQNGIRRALKQASRKDVEATRAEIVRQLVAAGLPPTVVNGAGTGSLHWACAESALTEVTAGSGFLCSQLFDYYADLDLEAAAWFALQVTRRPSKGIVTCAGGGYVASGGAGADKLPSPSLPAGCALLPLEGAGEVQTPVRVPDEPGAIEFSLGDPIFFRHAKAGELAEHFAEYLLVRGAHIESRVPTYRGLSRCFLG